jgi:hypothetical protein
MFRNFVRSVASGVLFLVCNFASANVITLNETYASGAVFNGSLTFQPDGQLVSGTGSLTGSSYNHTFGWIYGGSPTFGTSMGPNIGYTWLVDSFSQFGILVNWDYSNPTNLVFLTNYNGVYNGPTLITQNIDRAVSTQFGSVNIPEPASIGLLAAGLLGLMISRKSYAKMH